MTNPELPPDQGAGAVSTDSPPEALLTAVEARVLGCLMEKKYTTPNSYPLTLNALVQACNQKTSRHPVMHLSPGEVGLTLNHLRDHKLISGEFSGRSERYDERLAHHLLLDRQRHAILSALMLRGPQTPGELRINAARMADFDSMDAVHETIERLLAKAPPLVVKLPRMPGKREERYAHTLCGEVEDAVIDPARPASPTAIPPADNDRVTALEAQVAALRADLDQLWQLTGLRDPQPGDDRAD